MASPIPHYMDRPKSLFAEFDRTTRFLRNTKQNLGIGTTTPMEAQSALPNVWPVRIDGPFVCSLHKMKTYDDIHVLEKLSV